ncbi:unnamed protein product [Blepharisma stoltei]|uniref:Uncharacterized protein n=1 Tax=Blepharisma stoltei TaxID=1481888 RepID=A0AAU9JFJ4_9CILI|nr:unnamed protein product [Blepharisma stoltei]
MGQVCCVERENEYKPKDKNQKNKNLARLRANSDIQQKKIPKEVPISPQSAYDSDISYHNSSIDIKFFVISLQYIKDNLITQEEVMKIYIDQKEKPITKNSLISATLFYWGEYTGRYANGAYVEKGVFHHLESILEGNDETEIKWALKALFQLSKLEEVKDDIRACITLIMLSNSLENRSPELRKEYGRLINELYLYDSKYASRNISNECLSKLMTCISDFDELTQINLRALVAYKNI